MIWIVTVRMDFLCQLVDVVPDSAQLNEELPVFG